MDGRVILISLRRYHQGKKEEKKCERYDKSTLGFRVWKHKYVFVLFPVEPKRLKPRLKMPRQVTVNYSDYVSTQRFVFPPPPMLMSIVYYRFSKKKKKSVLDCKSLLAEATL